MTKVTLSLVLVLLSVPAFAQTTNKPPPKSAASPSGAGLTSTSPMTGTANYPADPNAATPSGNAQTKIQGKQQAPTGMGATPEPADNSSSPSP